MIRARRAFNAARQPRPRRDGARLRGDRRRRRVQFRLSETPCFFPARSDRRACRRGRGTDPAARCGDEAYRRRPSASCLTVPRDASEDASRVLRSGRLRPRGMSGTHRAAAGRAAGVSVAVRVSDGAGRRDDPAPYDLQEPLDPSSRGLDARRLSLRSCSRAIVGRSRSAPKSC